MKRRWKNSGRGIRKNDPPVRGDVPWDAHAEAAAWPVSCPRCGAVGRSVKTEDVEEKVYGEEPYREAACRAVVRRSCGFCGRPLSAEYSVAVVRVNGADNRKVGPRYTYGTFADAEKEFELRKTAERARQNALRGEITSLENKARGACSATRP